MESEQGQLAVGVDRPRAQGECELSVIMPTTSWAEPFGTCARRVLAMLDAATIPAEFIVVHDGEAAKRPAWLRRPGVRVLGTPTRRGPAAARNMAAAAARGRILFFVDADVELAADALDRVSAAFASDDGTVAVFGAYDDAPAATGVVSQFRNLLHHHTHVTHPGRAVTFWAGCGAVRAAHFHDVGGFDERYTVPSVEDVELGMRIAAEGGLIVLDPSLQGKHHKRWTLASMVQTDVTCRAVPWAELIERTGRSAATLAFDWRNRISGLLAVSGLVAFLVAAVTGFGWAVALAAACVLGVATLNLDFYRLCGRRRGAAFALAACGLHVLFFVYSSVTFGVVVLRSRMLGVQPRCSMPVAAGRAWRDASVSIAADEPLVPTA